MGLTTATVPYATVSLAQALYNVADDEIEAMRENVVFKIPKKLN